MEKTMLKTPLVLLMVTLLVCKGWCQSDDNIERIGNILAGSDRGVDSIGATLLVNDQALTTGRLFAFSAFFRSSREAVLQIWRPTNDTNMFRLIAEVRVKPSVTFQREEVYIESLITQKCIQVKNGDKLGCYTETTPAPIAYTFNAKNPTSLMNINPNVSSPHQIGNVVEFDTLTFPYLLSVAAYIDTANFTESDDDYVNCPKGRLIPKEPTQPPVTAKPPPQGDTGATGPQGIQGSVGTVGATGNRGVPGVPGVNGSDGNVGETGPSGPVGYNGTDGLPGGLGFTGWTGPAGEPGSTGLSGLPGQLGPPGLKGEPGTDGKDGKDGRDGKDGKDGKNANNIGGKTEAVQDTETSVWSNPTLIIILLVWLIIITVMMIILTCCFCWCAHKMKHTSFDDSVGSGYVHTGYNEQEYSSDPEKKKSLNRLSSFEPGQDWIRSMKPEDDVEYENSTIARSKSKKDNFEKEKPKPESVEDIDIIVAEDTINTAKPSIESPLVERRGPSTDNTVDQEHEGMSNRWSASQEQIVAY